MLKESGFASANIERKQNQHKSRVLVSAGIVLLIVGLTAVTVRNSASNVTRDASSEGTSVSVRKHASIVSQSASCVTSCGEGMYKNEYGVCVVCPAETYQKLRSEQTSCMPCPSGQVQPHVGQRECVIIPSQPVLHVMVHICGVGDELGASSQWVGWRGKAIGSFPKYMENMNLVFSPPVNGLGIEYRTHLADMGWTAWTRDGLYTDSLGKGRRLYGIAIRLYGLYAQYYNVEYQLHLGNIGDFPPQGAFCSNGQDCIPGARTFANVGIAVYVRVVRK